MHKFNLILIFQWKIVNLYNLCINQVNVLICINQVNVDSACNWWPSSFTSTHLTGCRPHIDFCASFVHAGASREHYKVAMHIATQPNGSWTIKSKIHTSLGLSTVTRLYISGCQRFWRQRNILQINTFTFLTLAQFHQSWSCKKQSAIGLSSPQNAFSS